MNSKRDPESLESLFDDLDFDFYLQRQKEIKTSKKIKPFSSKFLDENEEEEDFLPLPRKNTSFDRFLERASRQEAERNYARQIQDSLPRLPKRNKLGSFKKRRK